MTQSFLTPSSLSALRRPIFLVGTVRSGTTVISQCLGEHPRVCYAGAREGSELSAEWIEVGKVAMMAGCRRMGAEDATAEIRDAMHECFLKLLADCGGRPDSHFLNKNPHLSNKLGFVRALFPDALLAVTSRDLRSTVASTLALWERIARTHAIRHYLPPDPDECWSCSPPLPLAGTDSSRTFPGGDPCVIAEYWLRTHEAIDAEMGGFDRVTLIRHRDFSQDPDRVLSNALDELGVPRANFRLACAIDGARNERWRQALSIEDQKRLDAFAEEHQSRIRALQCADTGESRAPLI